MSQVQIGFITIGQSPRDDVLPDMIAQLDFDVRVVERGAIDDMSLEEVRRLAPDGDEPWFVSRMRDGTEVRLARRELIPRMQARVDELEKLGMDLIVPLCSADWSVLTCNVPFINPGRALSVITEAMLRPDGTLGLIMPTEAQAELSQDRYTRSGTRVIATFAQPYTDATTQMQQCHAAGNLLGEQQVDLIYMGCMGHTQEMRAVVRRTSNRPTVTANALIAALIGQALV